MTPAPPFAILVGAKRNQGANAMPGKTTLVLTADQMAISLLPAQGRILLQLDVRQWEQFLEHELAISLVPSEARQIARLLTKKADEAEAGSPQD